MAADDLGLHNGLGIGDDSRHVHGDLFRGSIAEVCTAFMVLGLHIDCTYSNTCHLAGFLVAGK